MTLLDKIRNTGHGTWREFSAALETHLDAITGASAGILTRAVSGEVGEFMRQRVRQSRNAVLRQFAATLAVSALLGLAGLTGASAQSGSPAPDQGKAAAQPADAAAKDAAQNQRRTDEFAEAAQVINGPAGNPECVWLGRRVVRLMWRDDLDTAFRHLDLYDRFGCPGGHIQAAFRCLTRFGGQIDPKVAETLDSRVHACWINPASQPQQAAAAASQPAAPAANAAQPQPAASPSPATSPTPAPQK
ncbi:hypothetical protein FBZ96_1021257 [Bradyrhizobium stylosanthis]|uniref:Beta-1-3, beta-1-6-glucan biosynthesis protein n=2 Tax=Nitrobacteraceae TaxID=41294 RepID=A0A560E622_9BRAD|nr:hypothetical protein FBZ96_1021257 [Bradyrhizobium stylosanthis]